MPSTQIVNAAPMAVLLGIQDNSPRALSVTAEAVPSHCPLVYLYAQKGPIGEPQLVAGGGAIQMFGADTFDTAKPYATHATALSNTLFAAGNAQMIERLVPADAPIKANFTLWMDVLATPQPTYQRNSDGTYILNQTTGLPIPTSPAGTNLGYTVKFVVDSVTTGLASDADSTHFGNKTSKVGDQTDTGGAHSTRYPILDFWADSFGAYANNAGFRIWAPQASDDIPVNSKLMSKGKVYPFRIAAIKRADATSTALLDSMITGDTSFEFSFKSGFVSPLTDAAASLAALFPTAWSSVNVPGYDPIYANLSGMHVYQSFINTLVGEFYAAENTVVNKLGSDFTDSMTDTSEQWMFNLLTGKNSNGAPYYSFSINTTDSNAVALSETTNLWATGGGDGTMNETLMNGLVTSAIADYANPLSDKLDTATHVETMFYDSGFDLDTKEALCAFISQRKDTFLVLSTYDVNGGDLSESEEAAIATSLKTRIALTPDSVFFGTPVVRGLVMGRYGTYLPSNYTKKLPVTLELAYKTGRMMGAGNGAWNRTYLFDKAPNSVLTQFSDLNVVFTPAQQRNTDWANGLNYPLKFTRQQLYFPALKTVYTDDTSVLANYFNALAAARLQRIGEQVWREFSGVMSLTEGQLKARVNQRVIDLTEGKFAGLFVITPQCTITASDELRGYSWTLPIQMYAEVSKTVETLYVQTYRMADLPTT